MGDTADGQRMLREKAREAIRAGRVQGRRPDRTLGVVGSGGICVVCNELITPTQMEVEAEYHGHGSESAVWYRCHPRCFAEWEVESRRPDPGTASSGPDVLRLQVGVGRDLVPPNEEWMPQHPLGITQHEGGLQSDKGPSRATVRPRSEIGGAP